MFKMISLIYGGDFHLFRPSVGRDEEEYVMEIVKQKYRYFGPFPLKFQEIAPEPALLSIIWLLNEIPPEKLLPFARTTVREVSKKDNVFISKMMKLDWRDRPTAAELLADEWWADED
jgi:hypothetical protein